MDMSWDDHQKWESEWHKKNNNCANSYNEETKQYKYAYCMGLNQFLTNNFGAKGWDFGKATVLDVGGGPYSILLKSKAKQMTVLDPGDYPNWTKVRYQECGIRVIKLKAEDVDFAREPFDVVLCYNVLQHVDDPKKVVENMKKSGKKIYFFDWIGIGNTPGHPHILTEEKLNEWLCGKGEVDGHAYFGQFAGVGA